MNGHDVALIIVAVVSGLPSIIAAVSATRAARTGDHNAKLVADIHHTINGGSGIVSAVKTSTEQALATHDAIVLHDLVKEEMSAMHPPEGQP